MKFLTALVAVFIFPAVSFSYQHVKVQGRQLLVDFDENGIYRPYRIEGAGYSPIPISRHPGDWGWPAGDDPRPDNVYDDPAILTRDFALLKAMNANTIRLWKGDNTQAGTRYPIKLTQTALDLAEQYGLKVIPGFWMNNEGFWQCTSQGPHFTRIVDFANDNVRNDVLTRFGNYVLAFKDHPAVLFWAIGNENNYSFGNDPAKIQAFYSLVEEMAELAHQIEGEDYHPVALINGDIGLIGQAQYGTTDAQLAHLDIWGANVYRGDSFGTFFTEYGARSQKPVWISEFGVDAWHTNNVNDPSDGQEDQATQADWAGRLWDEIADAEVTIGGTIMEYSDEWWKPYEWQCGANSNACNSTQNHFGYGPRDSSCPADGVADWVPPFPDHFFNEEWWGIVSIAPNTQNPFGPDIVTPRQVYTTLQNKFPPKISPQFDSIEDQTGIKNQLLEFSVEAVDTAGEELTLTAALTNGQPLSSIGASFTDNGDGTGSFSWNVTGQHGQIHEIKFKAFDPMDLFDEEIVRIEIFQHQMLSPQPGSTLNSSSVTFAWTGGNITNYWLGVGTTQQSLAQQPGGNIYYKSQGTNTSATVTGIPLNGQPVYVRLWSLSGSSWKYTDYIYQTQAVSGAAAQLTQPASGTTLNTASVQFSWDQGSQVQSYALGVGTSQANVSTIGSGNIFYQELGNTSVNVANIPLNGSPVYVRLWSKIDGSWQFRDYTFSTVNPQSGPAQMDGPAPGSTLTTSDVTFTWSGTGVTNYWLGVGTTPQSVAQSPGGDIYYQSQGTNTSVTVHGIPLTGNPVYVRLWYKTATQWTYRDYIYQTASAGNSAQMVQPSAGTTLASSSISFNWSAGTGVAEYWLSVGTTAASVATRGGGNVYDQTQGINTSRTVSGIPLNGNSLYVRLWSRINGAWEFRDYVYPTQNISAGAQLTSPATGSTITTSSVTFRWSPATGATQYWLGVGTSQAAVAQSPGGDIYYQNQGLRTSATVTGIPLTGQPIYVRLWSKVSGVWSFKDYSYPTSSGN